MRLCWPDEATLEELTDWLCWDSFPLHGELPTLSLDLRMDFFVVVLVADLVGEVGAELFLLGDERSIGLELILRPLYALCDLVIAVFFTEVSGEEDESKRFLLNGERIDRELSVRVSLLSVKSLCKESLC